MKKINSRQRRSNRFVPAGCGYTGCACSLFTMRWVIAYDRNARRQARRVARGKIAAKKCVPVPCPPFVDEVLVIM